MQDLEGLEGIEAFELNSQPRDETQRDIHKRETALILTVQKQKLTNELPSPEP